MTEAQSPISHESNEPLCATRLVAGGRCYAFEVRENASGRQYLRITESAANGLQRRGCQVVIFKEHLQLFLKVLRKAVASCDPSSKAYRVEQIREYFPRAYQPWTPNEEEQLIDQYNRGIGVPELAKIFQRQPGGIQSRLHRLGLVETKRDAGQRMDNG